MTYKIRAELKKHFPNLKFKVRNICPSWYEIDFGSPVGSIEQAEKWLDTKEEIHNRMFDFCTKNQVFLSIG